MWYGQSCRSREQILHMHIHVQQIKKIQNCISVFKKTSFVIVLDPRLKLTYYERNKWHQKWITNVKKNVTTIYHFSYKSSDSPHVISNAGLLEGLNHYDVLHIQQELGITLFFVQFILPDSVYFNRSPYVR